jgi:biotin transport system substrate-specific component
MQTATHRRVQSMVYVALFAVLIAICSWISIPMPWNISFTLQTFAVPLAVVVLGGRRGSLAVLVWLLLGAVGVPVFSGFRGGIGVLLLTTGGYILGFLCMTLVMWLMEALLGRKNWVLAVSMVLGLVVCYAFGTAWFMVVYARDTAAIGVATALGWCVLPYLVPDLVKLALALLVGNRLRGILKLA